MAVVPVLAAVLEAQNDTRPCKWPGKCYIGGEELVSKAIC